MNFLNSFATSASTSSCVGWAVLGTSRTINGTHTRLNLGVSCYTIGWNLRFFWAIFFYFVALGRRKSSKEEVYARLLKSYSISVRVEKSTTINAWIV